MNDPVARSSPCSIPSVPSLYYLELHRYLDADPVVNTNRSDVSRRHRPLLRLNSRNVDLEHRRHRKHLGIHPEKGQCRLNDYHSEFAINMCVVAILDLVRARSRSPCRAHRPTKKTNDLTHEGD